MDEKNEPVVSIAAGETPPADPPPPADSPPPDETPPDDAQLPAELPNGFAELPAPTLAEMSDQLAEDLYLDEPVARERLELTARQIAERYHLATAEAVDELARLPRTARAFLFATGPDEHALILPDIH